jgi:hypothetical protein
MIKLLRSLLWFVLAGSLTLSAQTAMPSITTPDTPSTSTQVALPEAPVPAAQPKITVADWKYFAVTGAMFASSAANSETLIGCPNCTFITGSMHRRGFTYGVGLSVDAAASYLGYELKKRGHRWWFVPAVALTAANTYLSYHWKASTD